MIGLSFVSKLSRGSGRRQGTPARKPAQHRLYLEALEERSLLSANVLQTNLVSDLPGVARFTDPNLVNPWGISQGPGPLWISDNNSGLSTIYNGQGQQQNPLNPALPPLIVSIPTPGNPAGHTGTPNGTVFNPTILTGSPGFIISDGTHSGPAIFLFATEDGTIVGWNPGVDPTGKFDGPNHVSAHGVLVVDNSGNNFTQPDPLKQTGAVYKGLTLATDASGRTLLYAADFRHGSIAVYDTTFKSVTTLPAGAFTDPHLPQGYAPFNVQALNNKIYVTYALQNAAKHDDVGGAGHGFIDIYNPDGTPGLPGGKVRLVSHGALDSPWGLAIAPSTFGSAANDLLVGNFKSGFIDIYDPTSGQFHGQLKDPDGEPIRIDHLWALKVGNGFAGTDTNTVYFTAGIDNEQHGLFGSLTAAAKGSPEGPADAQAVVAALDVVQIDLATLIQDMSSGASKSTIAQERQTLNRDFATLERAEQRLAEDSHTGQLAGSVARVPAVQEGAKALDAVFADLDAHLGDLA